MDTSPIIARIWDYGWLCREEVELPPAASDRELVESYVVSRCFHTSFLPSDKDETGIHGPFLADRLTPNDFVHFEETSLEAYLKALLYSPEWESPASAEQFATVVDHLREPFRNNLRCFLLKFDETHKALHHEWGFVFVVFREFLFLGSRPDRITRFVIGFD